MPRDSLLTWMFLWKYLYDCMFPLSGLDSVMTVYFGLHLNGIVRRFKLDYIYIYSILYIHLFQWHTALVPHRWSQTKFWMDNLTVHKLYMDSFGFLSYITFEKWLIHSIWFRSIRQGWTLCANVLMLNNDSAVKCKGHFLMH